MNTDDVNDLEDLDALISRIHGRLFLPFDDEMLLFLLEAFFDLSNMVRDRGQNSLADTLDELREVIGLIRAGKLPRTDLLKESAFLVVNLSYRQIINNESCEEEIAGVLELVRGVKLGDTVGFQVSDHTLITNKDDMIVLFDDDEPATAPPPPPVADTLDFPEPLPAKSGLKMLIADDEIHNRILLARIVGQYGEYDQVYDGMEAVDAFKISHGMGQPYDIVFLDIMMPNKDGHLVLQEIRQFEEENHVPPNQEAVVFMVTCLDFPKDVIRAFFKEYCTDYIVKPITIAKIEGKMREYGLI